MSELRRRVPIQNLRGVDALMLEVLASDLVEKPLGQLEPETVADLFAMIDVPEAPASIRKRSVNFRQRIALEIADLPNGPEYEAVVAEWRVLPGGRVPATLRHAWRDELTKPKRGTRERAMVEAMVSAWDETTPEPFVVAAPKPSAVRKAPMVEPRAEASRERRAPATPKPKIIRPGRPDEAERNAWTREVCIDRLAGAMDKGLLETVLLAGVRHRARELFPHMSNTDVLTVLKDLERAGVLRHSAARWSLVSLSGR